MKAKVAVTLAGLLLLALPLLAHHSFAAEYDANKPVTLKGTVTKFDWVNPHSRLFLDVKDDSGKVTAWEFETGNPTSMQRNGWKRDTLKPGDEVVVTGFRAKDGANIAAATSVSTTDGKKLLAGSNNTPTQ
jgi:hypothetical protein